MHHPNTIAASVKAEHLAGAVVAFVGALNGISLDCARRHLADIKCKLAEIEADLADPEPTVAHERPAYIDQRDLGDEAPALITGEPDDPFNGQRPVEEVA